MSMINQNYKIIASSFPSEDRNTILEIVRIRLYNPLQQKRKFIINQLQKIYSEELINIHRLLTNDIIQELNTICENCHNQELQQSTVDLFTRIINSEVKRIDYLIQNGIIQSYIMALKSKNTNVLAKVLKGLQKFIKHPQSLQKLLQQFGILQKLVEILDSTNNQEIVMQCLITLGHFFQFLNVQVNHAKIISIFNTYVSIARKNDNRPIDYFSSSTLNFIKYIFRNGMSFIFIEKGKIKQIIQYFEPYPQVVRCIFRKLRKNHGFKQMMEEEINFLINTFTLMIPRANLSLTHALIEIVRIILQETKSKLIEIIWKSSNLISDLKQSIIIGGDIAVDILEIYYLLIVHKKYESIASIMIEQEIVSSIVEAISFRKQSKVVQKGLEVIQKIQQFQRRLLKLKHIKICSFTQELRENNEVGNALERISKEGNTKTIRDYAKSILSKNFVKIKENIIAINLVCRNDNNRLNQ